MWNDRYSEDGYAYGTAPNDFLVKALPLIPKGRVLCLCEGEGRNAVFLAEQGYDVVAVDASSVGMKKAKNLASERGVTVETIVTDLEHFQIEENYWDGIISIFCHIPPLIRKDIHQQVCRGLKKNGVLVLEAYRPEQLNYKTGGPPTTEFMMTLNALKDELSPLTMQHNCEIVREIIEGKYHTGDGAVVQVIATK